MRILGVASRVRPYRAGVMAAARIRVAFRVLLVFSLLWRSCMGNCAYDPDSNGHVAIPEGVKEIPDNAFEQCAANELSTPVYDHRFNLRDFLLAEISIRIHEILWKCDQSNRNGLGKKT